MRSNFARANPLIGLTAEEYVDFASALVSYVALDATVDQATHFMNLFRHYSREIANKVAGATSVSRRALAVSAKADRSGATTLMGSAFNKSRSH